MGLYDRLRSAGQAATDGSKVSTSEQEASRLIDEGHALEAESRLDEAMQRYMDAIQLAPNPARGHLNRGNVLLLKGDLQGADKEVVEPGRHQDHGGCRRSRSAEAQRASHPLHRG